MREFAFITIGYVLDRLAEEGVPIKRGTYYRLEKRLNLPMPKKTTSERGWRVYTDAQVQEIIAAVKKEYNIP